MKVYLNGEFRDADILPAPKGAYYIDDGFAVFPMYVAFCEPTEYETERNGTSVICAPIAFFDEGVLKLKPYAIDTSIDLSVFKHLVKKEQELTGDSLRFCVRNVLKPFFMAGTMISEEVLEYERKVMDGSITYFSQD